MNHGEWMSVLEYLESKNDSGRREICHCSQCDGTYVHDRCYVNDDGDFVLSQNTLTSLLDDFKYSNQFDMGRYDHKTKQHKDAGFYYLMYWTRATDPNGKGLTYEEDRVMNALKKKEYDND